MEQHEILPKPQSESEPSPEQVTDNEYAYEKESAQQTERSPKKASGAGVLTTTAVDDAQAAIQGVIGDDTKNDSNELPISAEDVDLIEKEWVQKAKAIVQATQGDPYTQNKKLNNMKVAYIKKRYDKAIKQSEEV